MAWKKTDFLVWNNPIYRIYNWIRGPFCRCGGPKKRLRLTGFLPQKWHFSKAKKQHQAGWGEGDDGEDRLGQFFRLKDWRVNTPSGLVWEFAEAWRRVVPYTHGEKTWKTHWTWKRHGEIWNAHRDNTWRKHIKTYGKRLRSEQACFFFSIPAQASQQSTNYGKWSAIHEFWLTLHHTWRFFNISR